MLQDVHCITYEISSLKNNHDFFFKNVVCYNFGSTTCSIFHDSLNGVCCEDFLDLISIHKVCFVGEIINIRNLPSKLALTEALTFCFQES